MEANVFNLVYHGKGFDYASVMQMGIREFTRVSQKLTEQLQEEKRTQEAAMRKAKSKRKG